MTSKNIDKIRRMEWLAIKKQAAIDEKAKLKRQHRAIKDRADLRR